MADTQNQWDIKYLRSEHFFPYGSMMKAYGDMHNGKPVELKQFKEDAMEIFELAMQMGDISYKRGDGDNKGEELNF